MLDLFSLKYQHTLKSESNKELLITKAFKHAKDIAEQRFNSSAATLRSRIRMISVLLNVNLSSDIIAEIADKFTNPKSHKDSVKITFDTIFQALIAAVQKKEQIIKTESARIEKYIKRKGFTHVNKIIEQCKLPISKKKTITNKFPISTIRNVQYYKDKDGNKFEIKPNPLMLLNKQQQKAHKLLRYTRFNDNPKYQKPNFKF